MKMKRNRNGVAVSADRKAFNFLAYFFIIFVTILCLLPFWLVVIGSFTAESEIFSRGYSLWPHEFSLEAYELAFKYPDRVFRAYGITVSITALGTFLSLLITSLCGYALQREDFKSRGFFTMFVFFTMLFSGGLVPWYLLITNYLHLKDTYWVMILTQLCNVYFVILIFCFLRPFFLFGSLCSLQFFFRFFQRLFNLPNHKSPFGKPAVIGIFVPFQVFIDSLEQLLTDLKC